jgi:t-SNARE complex subunit (syntaxin)
MKKENAQQEFEKLFRKRQEEIDTKIKNLENLAKNLEKTVDQHQKPSKSAYHIGAKVAIIVVVTFIILALVLTLCNN